MAEVTLTPPPTTGKSKVAVAAAPTCFGFENVTVGASKNPPPALDSVTVPTPPISLRVAVAAAPVQIAVALRVAGVVAVAVTTV